MGFIFGQGGSSGGGNTYVAAAAPPPPPPPPPAAPQFADAQGQVAGQAAYRAAAAGNGKGMDGTIKTSSQGDNLGTTAKAKKELLGA